ncbi:uncharacterized protein LOC6546586 isoform X2 [Drosophila erecta]|uniref:uncharacterized protein LOC6546586 isoform X2 n=1 Tax=Drosophila erecta TaxID=7220 RepID=UPI000F04C8B5|nr:uncharacterized protein LOC6546586 isoform X2 [Drosophila erecta]
MTHFLGGHSFQYCDTETLETYLMRRCNTVQMLFLCLVMRMRSVYTNRHVNEDWYRLYRTYDTEGFVFGQFYERLQRYELD